MGFLDNVGKVLGIVADTAGKVAERERKKQSAINRGRMRKTDQIKGSSSNIPQEPGMYRHVNKQTGEIDYVGQTDNLRVRQQQHARDGKLNTSTHDVHYSVARNSATKDDLCETEKDHIKRNKPSGNKTKGGNGKR
ncbi:hypothetical protein [Vibrio sp. K4]|uniref:hypothetical protein n=1 Tax=Vibrio sp. K4 TaxID=3391579 RepID=UPI003DA7716D